MSPNLTRSVMVVAGDTLPALCHSIYGDSGYYAKVAAFNNLNPMDKLTPGTTLIFPPLTAPPLP